MCRNWLVLARAIALLVAVLAGASWGACADMGIPGWSSGQVVGNCGSYIRGDCDNFSCSSWNSGPTSCPYSVRGQWGGGWYKFVSPSRCPGGYNLGCSYRYRCETECEADSIQCINEGYNWVNTGASTCNGYSCKMSSCTSADTAWLSSSIATCKSLQGTNNYAIVDTNDVCEHRGICCPLDSLLENNSCKWRCLSQDSLCSLKSGDFKYSVVPDTAISGEDTTYTGICYHNCFSYPSKDGRTGSVSGNVTVPDTTATMASGTYYPDGFEGIRSEYGGLYVYDFLDASTYEWMDSLLSAPCSSGMYRGIKNGKYVYWKMGDPVPDGVTSVVRIK